MWDLLQNHNVQALLAAVGGCSGLLGFGIRYILKPYGKVVDGETSRLEREYQEALAAEAAAKRTADPNDDVAAHNVSVAAKKARDAKQRLRDFLSAIPSGE